MRAGAGALASTCGIETVDRYSSVDWEVWIKVLQHSAVESGERIKVGMGSSKIAGSGAKVLGSCSKSWLGSPVGIT